MPQPLERRTRGIERRAEAQRVERRLPGAMRRVRPCPERGGGGNRGQPARIERVGADLPGRQLQHGDLELAGPFARLGEHAARDAVARLRGDAAVRRTRRSKAEPVGRDAIDDELLFGERHDIDVRDQFVRLHEVLERLVRTGDREAADQDFPVPQVEMELLDLDLRAKDLRAHLLRFTPCDGVGEQPPQDSGDDEQHEQRPDRAPAEDLDLHGRNIL